MSTMTELFQDIRRIADKTGAPLETVFAIMEEAELSQQKRDEEYRKTHFASNENKDKLNAYLATFNGQIRNLAPKEICINAGVEPSKVNTLYVSNRKSLLLKKATGHG